ncbi:hypothetical protein FDJ70_02190 [Clostridium botulinum]|uniref:Membrane protein n=1 Tax=Clostridium botulinum D str. 1873 TaxID=592027 RepID=A0A9P2G6K1_CLOBO|nr:hypothetical protein [Clostridium botulinum]EES90902.1 membrane protein [Clostridium botulinum D str. 1873]NFV46497.1 hypothetical protein [Clostridium botulinum]
MKRFFKTLIIIIIFTFSIIFLKKYNLTHYNITLKDDNININLQYKGMKGAVDFTLDEQNNYYIAYKNRIQLIDSRGKSFDILKDKNLKITSIEFYKNKLYFASDTSVYCYDLHSKDFNEIIKDIPNFGDYKDSIIRINKNKLYVTVGSATNSGVVGEDNKWIHKYPFGHDISPYKITLKGTNFKNGKTGAFLNYETSSIEGQIVPEHFPGNASIILYNLDDKKMSNFAWGIRNVKGIDFDSKGKLIVSIGGMEDRGLRPIKGDKDYIYVVNKKRWYGWPDYSGGDPVNSPRFKGKDNKSIRFVLDNHPTTNPSAPIYTHKTLGSLGSLIVDKRGIIGDKDSIFFYDIKENKLFSLNKQGILKERVEFNNKINIISIKCIDNKIYILDSSKGNIYDIDGSNIKNDKVDNKPIITFIIIVSFILILSILKITISNYTNYTKRKK